MNTAPHPGKADVSELWEMLDEAQRADFEKALADGRLGNMVALWDPWWTKPEVGTSCFCGRSIEMIRDLFFLYCGVGKHRSGRERINHTAHWIRQLPQVAHVAY
jgi:hypothetical protein